jgi:hypothetical protein
MSGSLFIGEIGDTLITDPEGGTSLRIQRDIFNTHFKVLPAYPLVIYI